jgi:DNA repair protein RecN (Recombination protein N)
LQTEALTKLLHELPRHPQMEPFFPLRLRREIRGGRSRYYLNDQTTSLKDLRALTPLLADFHGQRDLAQLLERDQHADLLDALPAASEFRQVHDACFHVWKTAELDLGRLKKEVERQRERRELWAFQLTELEGLAAQPGEDDRLETEHRVMANAEELKRIGLDTSEKLYESDDALYGNLAGLQGTLAEARRLDETFAEPDAMLREALVLLQEAASTLENRASQLEWDPQRLAEIRERLDLLDQMIRKYGGSLDQLLRTQNELAENLSRGDQLDDQLTSAVALEESTREGLTGARRNLSKARKKAGTWLCTSIQPLLEELGIRSGRMDVVFEEPSQAFDPIGAERPAFYISTNPDTPLGPLEQIASGGELSRVMLALKTLLLENRRGSCLIFDEIDAGISGKAALAVANLMKRLAEKHQLLCITHLPQIAAAATSQLGVFKQWVDEQTEIKIQGLDEQGRVEQIAQLQSGTTGEAELLAAKRLLELSQ